MKAKDNLLKVFDELIEADQRSEPRVMIVRLYVGHNLFGNSWPFLWIIVLYYSSDACSQLDSVIKKTVSCYINNYATMFKIPCDSTAPKHSIHDSCQLQFRAAE